MTSQSVQAFIMSDATRPSWFCATLAGLALFFAATPVPAQTQDAAGQTPLPAVVIERIEVEEVSNPPDFTARAEAIEAVDIRARVPALLRTVAFEPGQRVQAEIGSGSGGEGRCK